MSEFLIAYIGKKDMPKEEGMKHRELWQAWLGKLGDAVVNPGTPLAQSKLVTAGGQTAEVDEAQVLTGFTVVKADSMDAALEMARDCPYLGTMGHLQVAQVMKMG